ncbi:WYL domain-containing protein [Prevotella hominis]|uniref:WYL domain-containing protein n=1 Tax=Segatella hominis TaxID=2518605 RepID=UPI001F281357|nr:WYL domain-containing protein [Segatella hominis]MCF2591718.1 WYL domain-containing protein [Segatella hominis]
MDNRVKFYSWLIGLLDRKHLTFEEIANEWRDANANQDEDELDKRTFHRYRENIQSQFGITVECNKSDGYRYYLKRDPVENDDVTEWMLSSLRLASLGDMLKFHNKVMLDTPPYNTEYLDDILAAIDKQYLLKFKYVSGFGAESDIVLQPAFVRYFKQRWYVIGVKSEERRVKNSSAEVDGDADLNADVDEKKLVRCLPFDRISFLKLICEKHPLSAKMKKFLTPENYYEDCFGIYRMEDVPVEKIRIRAFYPEYNYIEEVPLHESQQKVKESKDGMYREYTLTIRPSRDFLQELLWHGRNLIVLKPESLRQEMIGILKDMTMSYETGECQNGEE